MTKTCRLNLVRPFFSVCRNSMKSILHVKWVSAEVLDGDAIYFIQVARLFLCLNWVIFICLFRQSYTNWAMPLSIQ